MYEGYTKLTESAWRELGAQSSNEQTRTRIRYMISTQYLNEGRFSGAVLSK
jgi:hypothetical protein